MAFYWYESRKRGATVVALVVAGGQGTRLGHSGPKGTYKFSISGKSLFALHCERLVRLKCDALGEGASGGVPLYVMTSPLNDQATRDYFNDNEYFSMGKENVFFFQQGTLPCMSNSGLIIMKTPSEIATAPDGNGGVYRALRVSGALNDMEKRGIKYVHAYAVDNALVLPADPVFVGCCVHHGADVGNKACPKSSWDEKVGVMALRNGKYHVVEYSEIDEVRAKDVDPATGRLRYSAGNICNHWYTVDWLKQVATASNLDIPYHIARKKIPYHDEDSGKTVTPVSPNGIKLELFIFDVFQMSKRLTLMEVCRAHEFSPVKNKEGKDSPMTARNMLYELHAALLARCGAQILPDSTGQVVAEITPLVAYSCAFDGGCAENAERSR